MPGLATIRWELKKLQQQLDRSTAAGSKTLKKLREDPDAVMTLAGFRPDPFQTRLLRSSSPRTLLVASRQSGKSQVAAAIAVREVLLGGGLVLLVSPSLRQSTELFRKCLDLLHSLSFPVSPTSESMTRIEFCHGGRLVCLPGTEATVRSFSAVSLLVIDEAARVSDDLYRSVRPMLAVSKGRLFCLSSAFVSRGWFWESYVSTEDWHREEVPATACPRIGPEFLAEERAALGERWFGAEYLCRFMSAGADSVFSESEIDAAFTTDLTPLEF